MYQPVMPVPKLALQVVSAVKFDIVAPSRSTFRPVKRSTNM